MSTFVKMLGLRGAVRDLSTADDTIVFELERLCYKSKRLTNNEVHQLLCSPHSRLVLAHTHYTNMGYMAFYMTPRSLFLERCAVLEPYRRDGYTREMLRYAMEKTERKRVTSVVSEYDLDSQLWLKALGFKWIKTIANHFEGRAQSAAYLMRLEA